MEIDIGCRFEPTEEVLINCYLLPKILGRPLPQRHVILERDVYAAPPWIVFSDVGDSSPFWQEDSHSNVNGAKKSIYVFTKVAKMTENSTRFSRTAGCGTWSGDNGAVTITQYTGHTVGSSKNFTFQSSTAKSEVGHWIMHEYSLSGLSFKTIGRETDANDVVLCKITKCVKSRSRRVPQSVGEIRVPAKKRPRPDEEGVESLKMTMQHHQENGGDDIGMGSLLDQGINLDDLYFDIDDCML